MCGLGVAGLVEGGEEGEDAGGCLGGDGGIGGDSVGHLFFFFLAFLSTSSCIDLFGKLVSLYRCS